MQLTIYQIDAFTNQLFSGNPAAVVPLNDWLPDQAMQSIALENNLSETAFFVATAKGHHIRWFTPVEEVDLCGHATLASAFVIFEILGYDKKQLVFESRSGDLYVRKKDDRIAMDFPSQPPVPCDIPEQLEKAFHIKPLQCLKSEDYIVVFNSADDVKNLNPDMALLKKLDMRGIIATAQGYDDYDFVLRFFCPKYEVPEDPVTGSAFTQLAPFWANLLKKDNFKARQMSKRGGDVFSRLNKERVEILGQAVQYLEGRIEI